MTEASHSLERVGRDESGMILVALLAAVIPLVLMIGASSTTMVSRNKGLMYDIRQSQAMLAAESGIDEAIYQAANGNLIDGVPFKITIGTGMECSVEPQHLRVDGVDNDGDGDVDEQDEDVFRLVITGSFGNARRRIAAYLGPLPELPPLDGAATLTGNTAEIDIEQEGGVDPLLTGENWNMDGTRGNVANDTYGMAITDSPGQLSDLTDELDAYEDGRVFGLGGNPSVQESSETYDFAALELKIQNSANIVLGSDDYNNPNWGDGQANDFNIIYRDGELEVDGGQGAGILMVTGELEMEDGFRFDGLIICLGDDDDDGEFEMESDDDDGDPVTVYGAVLCGPDLDEFELEGDASLYYCQEVLDLIGVMMPSSRYIGFNGWQEISLYDETAPYVDPVIGSGTVVSSPVVFGSGAVIGSDCQIKENSTYGDGLLIGNNTKLEKECVAGNNLTVGNSCDIKERMVAGDNVIIGNNVIMGKDVQIGNAATVTSSANVPDGTIIPAGSTY